MSTLIALLILAVIALCLLATKVKQYNRYTKPLVEPETASEDELSLAIDGVVLAKTIH